jgi:hypothetical protein
MAKIIIQRKINKNSILNFELTNEEKINIYRLLNKEIWMDKIIQELEMIPRKDLEGHNRNNIIQDESLIEAIYNEFINRRNIRQNDLETLKNSISFILGEIEPELDLFNLDNFR